MNIDKKIIMMGLIIAFLVSLFPPWVETIQTQSFSSQRPVGYSFILSPPQSGSLAVGYKIDFLRLFVQWVIILFAIILIIYLRNMFVRRN